MSGYIILYINQLGTRILTKYVYRSLVILLHS